MVFAHIEVRTGTQTAHSGMYGGAALNAFHALHAALARGAAAAGRPPAGAAAGRASSRRRRPRSRAGPRCRRAPTSSPASARGPSDAAAATEFYVRTTAEPSLDVHRIEGGQARTIVVPVASADLSVRIVGGQRSDEIARNLEALLRDALPEGAELTFSADRAEPSAFDPESPALQAARRALARACGREPALVRDRRDAAGPGRVRPSAASRRSCPASRCPTTRCTRRTSPTGVEALEQGARAARALYEELAGLA